MSTQELFEGFDEETQRRYEQAAARRWGDQHVQESRRRWNSYSEQHKAQILGESGTNYRDLLNYIGQDPASDQVQAVIARWHKNLRYFYEPLGRFCLAWHTGTAKTLTFGPFLRKCTLTCPSSCVKPLSIIAGKCESVLGSGLFE